MIFSYMMKIDSRDTGCRNSALLDHFLKLISQNL